MTALRPLKKSSADSRSRNKRRSKSANGAISGASLGLILLAAAEAYRPGFLGLGELASWIAIAGAIVAFTGIGLVAAWIPPFRSLFKRSVSPSILIAVGSAVVLIPLLGRLLAVGRSDPQPTGALRAIVLGIDGATWDVIQPMIDRGELPNFSRLLQEGATGVLRSETPSLSPRVWTTIAAGVGPNLHGAQDFFSLQASVRALRLWEIVEANGGRIGMWEWLLTWPPGEANGFIVPGWLARGPETWPPELEFFQSLKGGHASETTSQNLGIVTARAYQNGLRLPTLLHAARLAVWRRLTQPRKMADPYTALVHAEMSTDFFIHWVERVKPDFGGLVLYAVDSSAHRFWKDYEPKKFGLDVPPRKGRFANALPDAYRQGDLALGRLMNLGDERTVLAVVSDHGSAARTDAKTLHTIRAKAIVRALDRKGELAAFAVGGRLHIRELEPSTGESDEPPAFVKTLGEATVDGRKVFEIEESDPPYYTVSLKPGGPISGSVRLGENLVPIAELLTVSTFTGEHTLNGIIGLWGPPIQPGAVIEDAGIRDLAPTLLSLMGYPISTEMDGRVLREAFTDRFNAGLRIRTVESYRVSPQQRSEQVETDEEVENRLRALGYLQ